MSFASSRRRNSCSQTRMTRHSRRGRRRFTCRSRAWLRAILSRQNRALVLGLVPCRGQPCQKQPSTNTATWSRGKMKSGRTRPVERTRRRLSVIGSWLLGLATLVLALGPCSLALREVSASEHPRFQPVMPFARRIRISRNSVSLLPEPRMRDITSERLALFHMSTIHVSWSRVRLPRPIASKRRGQTLQQPAGLPWSP